MLCFVLFWLCYQFGWTFRRLIYPFSSIGFDSLAKWQSHDSMHDDVMTWKRLPLCLCFGRGIHRSPVDSLHKGRVTWSFFDDRLYKLLSKHSSGRWFETPWCSFMTSPSWLPVKYLWKILVKQPETSLNNTQQSGLYNVWLKQILTMGETTYFLANDNSRVEVFLAFGPDFFMKETHFSGKDESLNRNYGMRINESH